jgi:predicted RNA-binding Zn-ribbon protein involved in translation (DUF1610 family)
MSEAAASGGFEIMDNAISQYLQENTCPDCGELIHRRRQGTYMCKCDGINERRSSGLHVRRTSRAAKKVS